MAWFREVFCAKDIAHNEYAVPWYGGPEFQNETVAMSQGIISAPVVQKSKEANMPVWLTMPTIFIHSRLHLVIFTNRIIE